MLKFIILFAFLTLGSNALFASYQVDITEQNSIDTLKQESVICFEVFGMDCPGCESSLEKQINKIEGVKNVKASWEKQKVEIFVIDKEKVSDKEIKKRIKKANFTPGEKITSIKDEE